MERIWVVEYDMGGGVVGACGYGMKVAAFTKEYSAQAYADERRKIYPNTKYTAVPYVREAVSEEPRG